MNLFFRLILTVIMAFRGPKLEALDIAETYYRVLPNDLDTNVHMTNARYLSIRIWRGGSDYPRWLLG